MTRHLFLFCAMLLSASSWGANIIINCGSTTLTTTYSTTSPSLALSQVPYKPNLSIFNASTTRICVNTVTASTTVAPTAGNGHEHCVPGQTYAILDNINTNVNLVNVYVRADGANCTSAVVDIDLF